MPKTTQLKYLHFFTLSEDATQDSPPPFIWQPDFFYTSNIHFWVNFSVSFITHRSKGGHIKVGCLVCTNISAPAYNVSAHKAAPLPVLLRPTL